MDEMKDISPKFIKWCQELGIESIEKCLLHKDFNQLFQSKELRNLWKYLIHNVKDENLALKVIGNLHLQNLKVECDELETSCTEVNQELHEVDTEIRRLEEKLKQTRKNCYFADIKVSKLQQDIIGNHLKSVLHEAQCKIVPNKRDTLKPCKNIVGEFCDAQKENVNGNNPEMLSCYAEIRELLLLLSELYESRLLNNTKQYSSPIWKKAFSIAKKFSSNMIVDALVSITKHDKEKVIECANKLAGHEEEDVDEKGHDSRKSIEVMIQNSDEESMKEMLSAVDCERKTQLLLQSVNAMMSRISQEPDYEITKHILQEEIEVKGSEAYLKSLENSIELLLGDIQRDLEVQNQLRRQQQEVNNFEKELKNYDSILQQTTKQNSQFRENILNHRTESLASAKTKLSTLQPQFGKYCVDLQTTLKEEQTAVDTADVLQLVTVDIDGKSHPVNDLSIHRPLKVNYESGGFAYQELTSDLGIHSVMTPSSLLGEVYRNKNAVDFHAGFQPSLDNVAETSSKVMKQIKDTDERVSTSKHEEKMFEYVNECKKWGRVLQEEEKKLETTLHEWFEQPAQHQAPWIKVDGMDLKTWKQSKHSS
ncbi:uncharacterized protein LOC143471020 [Clavelina lepadiformis]|uniref:uncharacterized protein LOC143471020 n=1 Tax=Clavelina lepadiformis TaxID=159417 RepID=UPI0040411128